MLYHFVLCRLQRLIEKLSIYCGVPSTTTATKGFKTSIKTTIDATDSINNSPTKEKTSNSTEIDSNNNGSGSNGNGSGVSSPQLLSPSQQFREQQQLIKYTASLMVPLRPIPEPQVTTLALSHCYIHPPCFSFEYGVFTFLFFCYPYIPFLSTNHHVTLIHTLILTHNSRLVSSFTLTKTIGPCDPQFHHHPHRRYHDSTMVVFFGNFWYPHKICGHPGCHIDWTVKIAARQVEARFDDG